MQEIRAYAHSATVEHVERSGRNAHDPNFRYRAVCKCGWKSAIRIDPNDADTLAENHMERNDR